MALKVFSNVGILCLEYPRKKDAVYSVEQLQSAGAEIRETLAKQGYTLLFNYARLHRFQISVVRKSDGATWLIALYDASKHGIDGSEAKFDRSLGWVLLVSTAIEAHKVELPQGRSGFVFIESDIHTPCELPKFTGDFDADKLNALACSSLKIQASYSIVLYSIKFDLLIDHEQAQLVQTLATNLNADWSALAKALAGVCLGKLQEMCNALMGTPAIEKFATPSIFLTAPFGINRSDGCDTTHSGLMPNKQSLDTFLEEALLSWAQNVFSPKISE